MEGDNAPRKWDTLRLDAASRAVIDNVPEESLDAWTAGPDPCVYFPERAAHAIVVDADDAHRRAVYSHLAQAGFRRTASVFYAPRCVGCDACVPLRVVVAGFRPNRRFRRVLAQNADLTVAFRDPRDEIEEHFHLYCRYILGRHAHGSMYPPSAKQFLHLAEPDVVETATLEVREEGRLVAAAVTDVLDHGLAAVYTYFDPELANRSLGVFAILQQIAECRRRALPHLYLGYWIDELRKMRYKADYRPAEVLRDGAWSALTDKRSA